jgi:chromosome segregation ATPase
MSDLKLQLEHCEETNAQLVNDLDECQQRKQTELSRLEKELRMQVDENDQLKRASEYLRHKISDMSSENAFLNTNLKDSMSKLETYEHQFNAMQSQAQSDKLEIKKLLHELKNEKVAQIFYCWKSQSILNFFDYFRSF